MSLRDTFLALLVPIVLGFGFVIAKPAMESFPPLLLNGLRWSLSGLIMFYFFPFPKQYFKQMIIISFVGCTLQYGLSYSGLNIIDGTSATLFVQAEIPFGILIAFFLFQFIFIRAETLIDEVIVVGSYLKSTESDLSPINIINKDLIDDLNISSIAEISKYITSSS